MGTKLILVQVDNVSGETMGFAIKQLVEMGAKNVQLLQSVTKKNRTGHVLLIDLTEDKLKEVALFLAQELGIWGYHVMNTEHVHFNISFKKMMLTLKGCGEDRKLDFKVKQICDGERLLSLTIEHDFLQKVGRLLGESNCNVSISALRSALEAKTWSSKDEEAIEIDINKLKGTFIAKETNSNNNSLQML